MNKVCFHFWLRILVLFLGARAPLDLARLKKENIIKSFKSEKGTCRHQIVAIQLLAGKMLGIWLSVGPI